MIPSQHSHLLISTATHEGMSGKNNEDRFGVFTYQRSANDPTQIVLAILCDGIGGHRAGEVAAELAVKTINEAVASSQADQPLATLRQGFLDASQAIVDQAGQDTERRGMGATCVCAWVIADRLYTAWVGDSRLYLLRGGAIRQLTTDHTWIQEALDYGLLTPEQAVKHPNQHVIRRYLGSAELPEVDFRIKLEPEETDAQALANQGLRLVPGDRLVLCSDGLSDLVTAEEILQAVQTKPREQALSALVSLANDRGGHDNITIVMLEYPGPDETKSVSTAQPASSKSPRPFAPSCLVMGLVLVMAFCAVTREKTGKFLA